MNAHPLVVRHASVADAAAIGEVHAAAWLTGYASIFEPSVLARLAEQRRTTRWPSTFTDPAFDVTTLLVAERAGDVVGFLHAGPTGGDFEVHSLNVHPNEWGKGTAAELMDAALAGAAGSAVARLWTWQAAGRARAFYEKSGFSLTGRTKLEGAEGGPALVEVEYSRVI